MGLPLCYLFASFKQLMGNRHIKKVSFGVGGDVGRVVKRFDLDALAVVGGVELAHEMAHLNLTKGSLADRVSAVFGEYLDKGIDHRCWEAPVKSERQIEYAITDAWAHLRLKQEAAKLTAAELAARTASPAGAGRLDPIDEEGRDEEEGGDEEEEEGGEEEEEDGESDDEMIDPPDEEAPARAATTRRHRRRPVPPGRRARRGGVQIVGGAASGGSHEPAVMMQVDAATGAPAGPDDGSEEPDEPVADEEDSDADQRASAAASALQAAKQQIQEYAVSNRSSDLELPSSFDAKERKQLHGTANTLKLYSRTIGIGGDMQVITHSFTHSLTHPPTHSPIHSPTHPLLTHSRTHSPTHPLTQSLTHSLTNSLPHPLTPSPTHSLTHSPTHEHKKISGVAI